jgi:Apea-like HEPN
MGPRVLINGIWYYILSQLMRAVFSGGPKAEPIILASGWLFDSYTGHDELLSCVQAMVVLEILLGDKAASDEIGLGWLLSNRCAYLIGKTQGERDDILRDFAQIYTVRSNIVHQGKPRLTRDELKLFYKLQWLCHRVIQKEIDLLMPKGISTK